MLSVADVTQLLTVANWRAYTEGTEPNTRTKTFHSACRYACHKSCKDWPGIQPDPPGERLATARPNNGATTKLQKSQTRNGIILKGETQNTNVDRRDGITLERCDLQNANVWI